MASVRWSRRALASLDGFVSSLERQDPDAAGRVVERVREAVDTLAGYPSLGRPGRVPGTRELVVPGTALVVPYRVRRGELEILAVINGRVGQKA